jgi:hypothetical protein
LSVIYDDRVGVVQRRIANSNANRDTDPHFYTDSNCDPDTNANIYAVRNSDTQTYAITQTSPDAATPPNISTALRLPEVPPIF